MQNFKNNSQKLSRLPPFILFCATHFLIRPLWLKTRNFLWLSADSHYLTKRYFLWLRHRNFEEKKTWFDQRTNFYLHSKSPYFSWTVFLPYAFAVELLSQSAWSKQRMMMGVFFFKYCTWKKSRRQSTYMRCRERITK